jgi:uncharacterized membrane protein
VAFVKPFITVIQLIQFVVILIHCVTVVLPDCNAGYFFYIQIVNFVVLTFLFGQFFVESYLKGSNKIEKKKYQGVSTSAKA